MYKSFGNLVLVKIYSVKYYNSKPTIIIFLCIYERAREMLTNVDIMEIWKYKNFWKASREDLLRPFIKCCICTIFTPQIYHYDTQVMYISFQRLTKCTLVYVQMLCM